MRESFRTKKLENSQSALLLHTKVPSNTVWRANLVSKMVLIHKIPLSSAFVKWPTVPLSREVDPLWVAKLQLVTSYWSGMDRRTISRHLTGGNSILSNQRRKSLGTWHTSLYEANYLIPHEIQVAFPTESHRNKVNHLQSSKSRQWTDIAQLK